MILSQRDNKDASNLEMSRLLRKPLSVMKQKVLHFSKRDTSAASGLSKAADDLRYMVYSAHDDQVTNMLNFLDVDYYWIPFAATVTFELKYSSRCLASVSTEQEAQGCFGVSIFSNGRPLQFEGECSGDHFTISGCTYLEFLDLMQSRWYSGPSADDLDSACFTPYSSLDE